MRLLTRSNLVTILALGGVTACSEPVPSQETDGMQAAGSETTAGEPQPSDDEDDTGPDDGGDGSDLPAGETGPSETDTGSEDPGDDDSGDETTGDGPVDTEPTPSSGCGQTQLTPGEHAQVALDFGGQSRSFDLIVPPEHDGQTPIPLVLNFHGWTQTPADHAEFSQMSATAVQRGFMLAYPAGIDNSWNAGLCCGGAQSQGIDDVGFARAVVAEIAATTCIDERRVYATGHSNGAFLSHRLACEAADVFAAIGSVAGVIGIDAAACTPGRAVPVMHMHGTGDTIVAIGGGGVLGHPSAQESTIGWVARNGCDATPTAFIDQGDTLCERWSGCGGGAEVVMCTIEGMGHCWPGNPTCTIGAPSTTVNGSEMFADFFVGHLMP